MIRRYGAQEKQELRSIVAQEFPIFVLGPGCFRVGYDRSDNPGWQAVEERVADLLVRLDVHERDFMRHFFFSKLSAERRNDAPQRAAAANTLATSESRAQETLEKEHDKAAASVELTTTLALESFEPWRSLLARELLRAFRHASCCLGLVIGKGLSPVLHWQQVEVPRQDMNSWSSGLGGMALDSDRDGEMLGEDELHFVESRRAIRAAREVAESMQRLSENQVLEPAQVVALADLPLRDAGQLVERVPTALPGLLEKHLDVLLPERIIEKLAVLERGCFTPPCEPLRGAHVEWLGDLLWHVLSSDAEVQPSQADLAFYITLCNGGNPTLPELRHAAYGDRRADHADITRLTRWSRPMHATNHRDQSSILRAVAVALWSQWDLVRVAKANQQAMMDDGARGVTDAEKEFLPALREVVALVGDYGDTFERTMYDLQAEGGQFHIAVPVWVTGAGKRTMDWLLASVAKDAVDDPPITWDWLAKVDDAHGPILFKLNGCDAPPLDSAPIDGPVSHLLASPGNHPEDAEITLAVLYDEHDRLTSMQAFEELIDKGQSGLAGSLAAPVKGLTWQDRSWVIMGQRFADWIPRLSLFTRMWAGSKGNKAQRVPSTARHWAIDREFDWPERSLLESLGITMIEGELGAVARTLSADAFTSLPGSTSLGTRFGVQFKKVERR